MKKKTVKPKPKAQKRAPVAKAPANKAKPEKQKPQAAPADNKKYNATSILTERLQH